MLQMKIVCLGIARRRVEVGRHVLAQRGIYLDWYMYVQQRSMGLRNTISLSEDNLEHYYCGAGMFVYVHAFCTHPECTCVTL